MPFTLELTELFLEKLKKIDKSIAIEIEKKIDKIQKNPILPAQRMKYSANYFRVYVRNFRVIYKVEGTNIIMFDIIKRKEGYEQFSGG